MPWGGDEERGQMPRPWYRRLPTLLQIFISHQAETLKSQVDGLTRTICIEIFQKDVSYEIN